MRLIIRPGKRGPPIYWSNVIYASYKMKLRNRLKYVSSDCCSKITEDALFHFTIFNVISEKQSFMIKNETQFIAH